MKEELYKKFKDLLDFEVRAGVITQHEADDALSRLTPEPADDRELDAEPEEWPELEEPAAWHTYRICPEGESGVVVYESTNDNLDRGYPSEYANWESRFKSLESALKHTGVTRRGIGCDVEVYLNGELLTELPEGSK